MTNARTYAQVENSVAMISTDSTGSFYTIRKRWCFGIEHSVRCHSFFNRSLVYHCHFEFGFEACWTKILEHVGQSVSAKVSPAAGGITVAYRKGRALFTTLSTRQL